MSAPDTPIHPSESADYPSFTHATTPRRTATLAPYDSANNVQYLPSTLRKKRQQSLKENVLPALDSPCPPVRPYKKRKPNKSLAEKIAYVLDAIGHVEWTLRDFLFHVFQDVDGTNKLVHRDPKHATTVQKFLSGQTNHYPAEIVKFWWHHRDGRLDQGSIAMFSPNIEYTSIKPVRPGLSSFALQLVKSKLVKEARYMVLPAAGLHTSRTSKSGGTTWADIGATTVPAIAEILKQHMPTAWYLFTEMAAHKPRQREGQVIAVRKNRPVEVVSTHALTSILFARNQNARLLPVSKGILYFSLSAPTELFAYESRIGNMPSWGTVQNVLQGLARQEAALTREVGRDTSKWGVIVLDNVQQYVRKRDHRFGNENSMSIGVAATHFELDEFPPNAPDLADKLARIASSKRKDLHITTALGWLDHGHLETVGVLHWLRTLTDYIPELARHKAHVSMLFRTRAAKYQIPATAAKVHALATNGKNETVITELKDALLDFLSQLGLTRESFEDAQIILAAGDSLTYEKLLLLKKYLQTHTNKFENFSFIPPVLAPWHTEATNLSRAFETHWGKPLSTDPSTLGHSATSIGRAAPTSLKKVDYYPSIQLLSLVYDVRQLDCWRLAFKADNIFEHFESLAKEDKLPPFEDLEKMALQLYRSYTSSCAQYRALYNVHDDDEIIPLGTPWTPPPVENSADLDKPTTSKTKKKSKKDAPDAITLEGDRVLANSINFMRDAFICRECAYAIAEGDAGRLYECLKVMIFTFAGSTHGKYCPYLLEFVTDLELESSEDLKNGVLHSLLVNLSGKEGSFNAVDITQEHSNRLLEGVTDRKGGDFGSPFIRDTVSPNLLSMGRIKKDLLAGILLAPKSGRHSEPHTRPEVKTLLDVYSRTELHSRRPGQVIDDVDRDNFAQGVDKLRSGRLRKWVTESAKSVEEGPPDEHDDIEDGIADFADQPVPQSLETFGSLTLENGAPRISVADDDMLTDIFSLLTDGNDDFEEENIDINVSDSDSDGMSVGDLPESISFS